MLKTGSSEKTPLNFLNRTEIMPTAMMDISDGLSSEILHICKQSDWVVFSMKKKFPLRKKPGMQHINLNWIPPPVP